MEISIFYSKTTGVVSYFISLKAECSCSKVTAEYGGENTARNLALIEPLLGLQQI